MKTTNVDIIQESKRDYKIRCKYCDWSITYLNTTYWKVERQMEMFASMPKVTGTCEHSLFIAELPKEVRL